MKILTEHYNALQEKINKVLEDNPTYYDDVKKLGDNISPTCARWNLFNMACDRDNYALARELWAYLTDDNIDTALRKITGVV